MLNAKKLRNLGRKTPAGCVSRSFASAVLMVAATHLAVLLVVATSPASLHGQQPRQAREVVRQPLPGDPVYSYNAQLRGRLEAEYEQVVRNTGAGRQPMAPGPDGIAPVISGEQSAIVNDPAITSPTPTNTGGRFGTPTGEPVVMGQIMVRDQFIMTANQVADNFDGTRTAPAGSKGPRLDGITQASQELGQLQAVAAQAALTAAQTAVYQPNIRGPMTQEQIDAMYQRMATSRAAKEAADAAAAAADAVFKRRLEELVREYPEIAIHRDGVSLWEALNGFQPPMPRHWDSVSGDEPSK